MEVSWGVYSYMMLCNGGYKLTYNLGDTTLWLWSFCKAKVIGDESKIELLEGLQNSETRFAIHK